MARNATGRGGGSHPHGPGVPLGTPEWAASKLTSRRRALQHLSLYCVRMALSVLDDGGEANGNLSMVARFSPPPVRGQPRAVNGPRAPRKPTLGGGSEKWGLLL